MVREFDRTSKKSMALTVVPSPLTHHCTAATRRGSQPYNAAYIHLRAAVDVGADHKVRKCSA